MSDAKHLTGARYAGKFFGDFQTGFTAYARIYLVEYHSIDAAVSARYYLYGEHETRHFTAGYYLYKRKKRLPGVGRKHKFDVVRSARTERSVEIFLRGQRCKRYDKLRICHTEIGKFGFDVLFKAFRALSADVRKLGAKLVALFKKTFILL